MPHHTFKDICQFIGRARKSTKEIADHFSRNINAINTLLNYHHKRKHIIRARKASGAWRGSKPAIWRLPK